MLRSRACLSRCVRDLGTSHLQTHLLRCDGLSALATAQQRAASSYARNDRRVGSRPRASTSVRTRSTTNNTPPRERVKWETSDAARALKAREERALHRPVNRELMKRELALGDMWLGKRDPRMTQAEWDRRKKELQYLRDPLDVAAFVKQELAKGNVKEMLQLVRMASHSMQVIVSWNHIIDHLMKTSVSQAIKVYQDMKKRAQFPDSYTYTILLRGLANHAGQSGVASKAIAIYHSMSAPNSKVQPSIIHTNATLNVCARALDMDALWGFAAKIPESGPGAADVTTFTTILNAVRQSLLIDAPLGEGEVEKARRRERGIVEGRRMWEDVVHKWRNADIVIEEELVCAMGRLLLVGSRPRDWDDVLSLVEQTMDIPRLVPRLGTIARNALPRIRAPDTPPEFKFDDDHLGPNKGPVRGDEFLPITPEKEGETSTRPLTYATPSNATLSMILEACQKVIAPQAATEYWDMLTDSTTYAIVPDNNNLHQRLRLLRFNRASTAALRMLKEDFPNCKLQLKPGTFRLAMSTCVRDKNNHNSLRNASELLQLMLKTLPDADAKTTMRFAELALTFPLANGDDLVNALTILQPVVKSLRIQIVHGTEEMHTGRDSPTKAEQQLVAEARDDAMAALRKVYGVYDRLLNSNLIAEEAKAPFKAERARLSAFFQRTHFKARRAGEARGARKGAGEKEGFGGGALGELEEAPRKESRGPGSSRVGEWGRGPRERRARFEDAREERVAL